MMAPMRRWLLLLMIALLPLRGWVGEALAGEMLQRHAPPAVAVAPTHQQHAAAHEDCAGHEHAQAQAPASQDHGDCPTCADCQACSAAVLVGLAGAPVAQRFTQPLPAAREPSHREAAPQSPFKPPIS